MSKKTNPNVAIVFDDLTEFFVMQDAINDMQKSKIPVDIIVPYDSGYNGLAEHTIKKIKELGYSPINDAPKNKVYQVLLTPYPQLDIVKRLSFIYHIRYPYGAATTKPNPVFLPSWKLDYDAILSFNTNETEFLTAYGAECFALPYWNYYSFKKDTSKKPKKTLLILPTFGSSSSCVDGFTKSNIDSIKKQFHIIAKAHHATHFNPNEKQSFDKLKAIADEFYDSDTQVASLFKKADLVLSDNSGAIFEAICTETPVVLFTKTPNEKHLGPINTLQYNLIQDKIIPIASNPRDLLPVLLSAQSYAKKQLSAKKELFLPVKKDSVHQFTILIYNYLNKTPDTDYRKYLHDLMLKERDSYIQQINSLENSILRQQEENEKLKTIIDKQNQSIQDIYNSTSWKITRPLRNSIKFLKRKEKNE